MNSLKNRTGHLALSLVICSICSTTEAQNIDSRRSISYQGIVAGSEGALITGHHQIVVTLYTDDQGLNRIWQGDYNTDITNGVFNLELGSGQYPLPSIAQLDRPLWVGLTINGKGELRP